MAKAKPFDAAEYLDSPEMIAAYLNEALEPEDASAIAVAIGTVARARGMSAVAEEDIGNPPFADHCRSHWKRHGRHVLDVYRTKKDMVMSGF